MAQTTTIGKSADYSRNDFIFPRTQRRDTQLDVKSAPPFKPSFVRNLIGELLARIAA